MRKFDLDSILTLFCLLKIIKFSSWLPFDVAILPINFLLIYSIRYAVNGKIMYFENYAKNYQMLYSSISHLILFQKCV